MSLPADAGLRNIEYTAVGLCFQSLVYGEPWHNMKFPTSIQMLNAKTNRHICRPYAILHSCSLVSSQSLWFSWMSNTQYCYRKRGLKSRSNVFMTLFMFALSTAYWAASVANLVAKNQVDCRRPFWLVNQRHYHLPFAIQCNYPYQRMHSLYLF